MLAANNAPPVTSDTNTHNPASPPARQHADAHAQPIAANAARSSAAGSLGAKPENSTLSAENPAVSIADRERKRRSQPLAVV